MAGAPEADAVIVNPLRASGVLDAGGLERARAFAQTRGSRLADALLRLEVLREGDFLRVFAELYGVRYVKGERARGLRPEPELLERVGVRSAERLRLCPLRWDEATQEVHVIGAVPLSARIEPELRQLLGARAVVVYVATPGVVAALVRRSYYGEVDAFAAVTDNGAGPEMPAGEEPIETQEVAAYRPPSSRGATQLVANHPEPGARASGDTQKSHAHAPARSVEVSSELAAEEPQEQPAASEGKTVMVSLDQLTIDALKRENARYRMAQEFHRRVSLERSVEAMTDRILTAVFELLNADGAAVWLTSGRYASKSRQGDHVVEVPRAVIDEALASTQGLLTNNALLDERFDRSQSVVIRGVKSVMAVPLRTRAGMVGILYVESISMSAAFTDDDLPLLDAVGSQAAILLENAALVAQVQREVELRSSLSRFLSQAAVEEVVSGRMTVHMQGQLADVTVLFADLRGFTTMSSYMRPEEVVRFLNAFFAEAVDAVERHGGVVDKFIGDSVMALWGAVDNREDAARKAITAALEMVERGSRILVGGQPLEVGVGINTGPAVVGAIGSQRRLDYTAIGATVNVAARLCSIAQAGEVLVTSDTLMRAGPGVRHVRNEPVLLKGLDVPVVPYTVQAIAQPLQLSRVMPPAEVPGPRVPPLQEPPPPRKPR